MRLWYLKLDLTFFAFPFIPETVLPFRWSNTKTMTWHGRLALPGAGECPLGGHCLLRRHLLAFETAERHDFSALFLGMAIAFFLRMRSAMKKFPPEFFPRGLLSTHFLPIHFLSLPLLALTVFLTGCYTQLATRGYSTSSQVYPAYSGQAAPADSLPVDSAWAEAPADSLAPPAEAPTVIVNHYYDPYLSHRGYAHWQWDYPLLSFGYYSSHYDRYYQPYWWNEPSYVGRYRYHHPYRNPRNQHLHHGSIPARPSTPAPSGPYKSNKRLFNSEPNYPILQKGQRGQRAAQPASAPVETQSAPKESASEDKPQPSSSRSSEAQPQSQQSEGKPERAQKGRRR
jgi:hypothetical protein